MLVSTKFISDFETELVVLTQDLQDWICNWIGNYDAVQSIAPQEFVSASIKPYTVGGKKYGEYKTAGKLNWLRAYEAGHEVPAYQPEAALAAFTSIMSKQSLKST